MSFLSSMFSQGGASGASGAGASSGMSSLGVGGSGGMGTSIYSAMADTSGSTGMGTAGSASSALGSSPTMGPLATGPTNASAGTPPPSGGDAGGGQGMGGVLDSMKPEKFNERLGGQGDIYSNFWDSVYNVNNPGATRSIPQASSSAPAPVAQPSTLSKVNNYMDQYNRGTGMINNIRNSAGSGGRDPGIPQGTAQSMPITTAQSGSPMINYMRRYYGG